MWGCISVINHTKYTVKSFFALPSPTPPMATHCFALMPTPQHVVVLLSPSTPSSYTTNDVVRERTVVLRCCEFDPDLAPQSRHPPLDAVALLVGVVLVCHHQDSVCGGACETRGRLKDETRLRCGGLHEYVWCNVVSDNGGGKCCVEWQCRWFMAEETRRWWWRMDERETHGGLRGEGWVLGDTEVHHQSEVYR